jgi:hypothetical protein
MQSLKKNQLNHGKNLVNRWRKSKRIQSAMATAHMALLGKQGLPRQSLRSRRSNKKRSAANPVDEANGKGT